MLAKALVLSFCALSVLARPKNLEEEFVESQSKERSVALFTPILSSDCHDAAGNPISRPPFANPADCSTFYMCSGGYRTEQNCAPGTVFNPAIGVCDWPSSVPGCPATPTPTPTPTKTSSTTPTTTSSTTSTTLPTTPSPYHPDCVDAAGHPISGAPYEKPGDCDHFYQCSGGHRHEMPCAPGTVFDPTIGVCNWPSSVPGCSASPTPTTTSSTTSTTLPTTPSVPSCTDSAGNPLSTEPFEKPGDCLHFYQCGAGILYVMPCGTGTVFNPVLKVCDWPSAVPGC